MPKADHVSLRPFPIHNRRASEKKNAMNQGNPKKPDRSSHKHKGVGSRPAKLPWKRSKGEGYVTMGKVQNGK